MARVSQRRKSGWADSAFGVLLRRHRLAAGLSQEVLAEQARMSANGIGALERGDRRYPYRETVVLLAKALSLAPAAAAEFEAAALRPREPRARVGPEAAAADDPGPTTNLQLSPVVDRKRSFFAALPSPRNPYFTGREAFLEQVRATLQACRRVALSGLGGLGKTQAALEYVYRHGDAYDQVFWIHAETDSTITSGFVEMADLFEFPQHSTIEAQRVVAAVLRWLETHERWLLIADNADDPRLLRPFLPRVANGHLLVTSRAQVLTMLGITNPIQLQAMSSDEALRFLLARTGRDDADPREQAAALTLAQELGYLPLALEQAAAYIHENGTRFADYVAGYRTRRLKLLARGIPADYPTKSVTTTWQIAFDRLGTEPASADLLRASAFLGPDRMVAALNRAFPDVEYATWAQCERLLAHAQVAAQLSAEHQLLSGVAARLLHQTAHYLYERARFAEAEPLYRQSLTIRERVFGQEHPDVAQSLNNLAELCCDQGRYAEAEALFQRSLTIRERVMGSEHPDVAQSLFDSAWMCARQGRYAEADRLFQRSLTIRELVLGSEHPEVALVLKELADLYRELGRFAEAEPLIERALTIGEGLLGPEHPDVAQFLNSKGWLYVRQGRYREAELFCLRDPFGELLLLRRPSDGGAGIERQVPHPGRERQQRFERLEPGRSRSRDPADCEARLCRARFGSPRAFRSQSRIRLAAR